ncbi:hypothetical protein BDZ97DRAFT_1922934 [Flammula alnicola]|nr:hypothetical protein BDZ97DRAFT_1922934 [Flammula alnicola]
MPMVLAIASNGASNNLHSFCSHLFDCADRRRTPTATDLSYTINIDRTHQCHAAPWHPASSTSRRKSPQRRRGSTSSDSHGSGRTLSEVKKMLAMASKGKEKKEKKDSAAAGADVDKAKAGASQKKKGRFLLKTGGQGSVRTGDYGPAEMCRARIERIVRECFTTFGGPCLETPVFEHKDVLTDKTFISLGPKGLDGTVADKIGEYVKCKGGPELLMQLEADMTLTANKSAKQGISDMGILFTLLEAYNVIDKVGLSLRLRSHSTSPSRGAGLLHGLSTRPSSRRAPRRGSKTPMPNYTQLHPAPAPAPAPAPTDRANNERKSTTPDNDDGEKEIDESQVGVGSIAAGGGGGTTASPGRSSGARRARTPRRRRAGRQWALGVGSRVSA